MCVVSNAPWAGNKQNSAPQEREILHTVKALWGTEPPGCCVSVRVVTTLIFKSQLTEIHPCYSFGHWLEYQGHVNKAQK